MYALGKNQGTNQGTSPALVRARRRGGYVEAMYTLSRMLTREEPATARRYYEQAAAHGDAQAMAKLGDMLAKANRGEARQWYERARAARTRCASSPVWTSNAGTVVGAAIWSRPQLSATPGRWPCWPWRPSADVTETRLWPGPRRPRRRARRRIPRSLSAPTRYAFFGTSGAGGPSPLRPVWAPSALSVWGRSARGCCGGQERCWGECGREREAFGAGKPVLPGEHTSWHGRSREAGLSEVEPGNSTPENSRVGTIIQRELPCVYDSTERAAHGHRRP